MKLWKLVTFLTILLLISIVIIPLPTDKKESNPKLPFVKINIDPYTTIYEGDIINCTITGSPTIKYWSINNQSKRTTFQNNDPIIFDPEPTPLDTDYVDLTIFAENEHGGNSDTVRVMIKRIYFGDIHWHSELSDGHMTLESIYKNAIEDNYLDFAACTDHGFLLPILKPFLLLRIAKNWILYKNSWQHIKDMAIKYYEPGKFTTMLGFEWSASNFFPGGKKWSEDGRDDVSHINFYYRDVYPDAEKYSPLFVHDYDDIFKVMKEENDKGHQNIGFMHHPLGKMYFINSGKIRLFPLYYDVNWKYLAREVDDPIARDTVLRGVEVYNRWGNAIGQYSNIPIAWPYHPDVQPYRLCNVNLEGAWVENAMWEWSENSFKNKKFVMQAGSDSHETARPGSANLEKYKVSGIMAAYSVHNTREEIWDSMNDCSIYATQQLKIRANVRFDDQMNLGGWINCTGPLNITVTAMSTFPGLDNAGKSMCPDSYSEDELDYPIQDIWIVKKDRDQGQPWCKVIKHITPDEDMVVLNFQDYDVQPNDFYYVAIRQKGQDLVNGHDEYMTYIGPVFINNVE